MSRLPRTPPLLASLAIAAGPTACGSGDEPSTTASPDQPASAAQTREKSPPEPMLRPATCPADLANCKVASGRVIYVERVDPDGDGDAHCVLASAEEITGPGISVIDVERELRPHPLPGVGAELSAAGPVLRGSYGQRQIEAVDLRVAR